MRTFTFLLVIFSLVLAVPAGAIGPRDFSLPEKAVEVSNGVFSLGRAYDIKSDSFVEGYAIVHKKGNAKGGNGGGSAKPPKNSGPTCYAALAKGAVWKSVEPWESYAGGVLDQNVVLSLLNISIDTWEDAAGANILGEGGIGTGTVTDPYIFDDINQVSFGNLDSNTIAVTVVWGIFSGPTFRRELVAWDQVYNTDYQWTDDALVDTEKMDFWNIAIHELGHSMGLADIYDSSCNEVTMYGYGVNGEIIKRDLTTADITGINTLY